VPRLFLIVTLLGFLTSPLCAQKRSAPTPKKPGQSVHVEGGQYSISEITVSGSERYDAEDVIKFTRLKSGKDTTVSLDEVKAAAQKLADSGAFSQVNYKHIAAPKGVKIEFTLGDIDDSHFIKCEFQNIAWFNERELLVELHERVPLFNGTVPRSGTLADDVGNALQALLHEHDLSAEVVVEHQDPVNGDRDTEAMAYRVANVDMKIAKVTLEGISQDMQPIAEAVSKRLSGSNYSQQILARFTSQNLRDVYLQHGYLRATFGPPRVKVLPGSTATSANVEVGIPVIEGQAYKAHDVRWSGNKAMSSEKLDGYLPFLIPGVTVDGLRLKRQLDFVRYQYAQLGYLHMLLSSKPVFNDVTGIVDYEMSVKEGDLFEMGKFEVQSPDKVFNEKVRLAWKLREGDPFDPKYLNNFLQNIKGPRNSAFLVDEAQGERPRSIDVTIIVCAASDPCKPNAENRLYTPPPGIEDGSK
jgi:outer membrane protein assembly factor BamA